MIEFLGLCVCSACLSCLCCLVTGGLCMVPTAIRLRNKFVEMHCPEEMQWLGYPRVSKDSGSDSSSGSSSDCSVSVKRKNCAGARVADDEKSAPRQLRKGKKKSPERRSKPTRWLFCFSPGKSAYDSSDCCLSVEEKRKKGGSKRGSKSYRTVYFKSCSCTSFATAEASRKRKSAPRSKTKCSSKSRRASKNREKKYEKCKCKRRIVEEKMRICNEENCEARRGKSVVKRHCDS